MSLNPAELFVVPQPAKHLLSPREEQVLGLLVDGASTKEIADTLCLSPKTVDAHVINISRKIGAKTRFHAGVLVGVEIGKRAA